MRQIFNQRLFHYLSPVILIVAGIACDSDPLGPTFDDSTLVLGQWRVQLVEKGTGGNLTVTDSYDTIRGGDTMMLEYGKSEKSAV